MKTDIKCQKCNVIHDVEAAGGHDIIEAQTVALCECAEYPDDEYCKQILDAEKENKCLTCEESGHSHHAHGEND